MFGLGTTELIVIGVIVFLIFGAKRIPEIGKGLGGVQAGQKRNNPGRYRQS
ncbi:MAG: twin-arginine translocase TatA/TatE family subunit [Deltaproteobacteria bacterium]|nr:twin-arginine translocase TatA/TatE family subunit [Deltaproteobacteria bacterium]